MTPDPPEMRLLIQQRMRSLGVRQAQLSMEVGQKRTYFNDYFTKQSPLQLPKGVKLYLADRLHLTHEQLGIKDVEPVRAPLPIGIGELTEDGVPYEHGPDLAPPPEHITLWRVLTRALDQHPRRILPGMVLAVNTRRTAPAMLKVGEIVAVEVRDRRSGALRGVVFRQFLPPDKLVTNSSSFNDYFALESPRNDFTARIIGAYAYTIDLTPEEELQSEAAEGASS